MEKKKSKILFYVAGAIGLAAGAYGLYMLSKKKTIKQFVQPMQAGDLIKMGDKYSQISPAVRSGLLTKQ